MIVTMKTPRVKCLSCGCKTWHQPTFAEGQRQVTKEFKRCLEGWLSRLTIQDVVETFGVSWNTVCDLDLRRLKKLARPQLAGLKRLAIDENYLGKTHKYITVVLDLDTRAIVSVAKGRGQAALKGFFSRLKQAGAKIKAVATDMAGGYIAAVMTHLPKAKLVFDHFHVIKLMNDKLTALASRPISRTEGPPASRCTQGDPLAAAEEPREPREDGQGGRTGPVAGGPEAERTVGHRLLPQGELRLFWKQPSKRRRTILRRLVPTPTPPAPGNCTP